MKLYTINSKEKEDKRNATYVWHNYFLWIPRKVAIFEKEQKRFSYEEIEGDWEYSWLWLETVERKCNNPEKSFGITEYRKIVAKNQ